MNREEFESDPVWDQCHALKDEIARILPSADASERRDISRVEFIVDMLLGFRESAGLIAPLMNIYLTTPVRDYLETAKAQFRNHPGQSGYSQYTNAAREYAEHALTSAAAWPRPYAKGAQAQQMKTLFQDLIESQQRHIEALELHFAEVERQTQDLEGRLRERESAVLQELEAFSRRADSIDATIESEKQRIDAVVQTGMTTIDELKQQNNTTFKEWSDGRREDWKETINGLKADAEASKQEAEEALAELKKNETEFANVTSAATAGKLAREFETEATNSKRWGLALYLVGALFLAIAAIPLASILGDHTTEPDRLWPHLAARISIGILAASGATVLIRLGARFVTNSTASKRMALELRTMGPFLANVEDRSLVDSARLELVDRAFGKGYGDSATPSTDEGISASAFSHVVDLIKAVNK
ncbi:hypothetical protein RI444_07675 [Paenarthrobacter sp. AT5]|uniref:hypothetical protein n=1 Tax=Paenarthrobacter TaxID=1742992 RepID=UPI001A9A00D3|nr:MULTISPECIES: hypothetical protein [Paenarthrobacter]QSZ54491.1 hypothetical protein AYX19_16895 [Paenarthrobacter ureafaciens]WOC62489.1 hypothetical protein RI444_07675 [Paenarthrobacter sp. AT5]